MPILILLIVIYMLPTGAHNWKYSLFYSILFYGSGEDVVWKVSRLPPWHLGYLTGMFLTILILNHLNCYHNVSYQVSVQSNIQLGRRCHLKNSKMVEMAAILDIGNNK